MYYLPTGSMWNTPLKSRATLSFEIFKSIGIGPGEVILFGGRSSFKRNDTFSKCIWNKIICALAMKTRNVSWAKKKKHR